MSDKDEDYYVDAEDDNWLEEFMEVEAFMEEDDDDNQPAGMTFYVGESRFAGARDRVRARGQPPPPPGFLQIALLELRRLIA